MNLIQALKNIYYESFKIPLTYQLTKKYHIENSVNTIQHIIDNESSICRFGDGEFSMIFGRSSSFQNYDSQLAKRLLEVITSEDRNILIGIPKSLQEIKNFDANNSRFWKYYTCLNYKYLKKILAKDKIYYDSLISRFYNPYNNKSGCKNHLELLKKIWNNRDVCIVEGSLTRSGIGNDLYNNTKSIVRVLCPSQNAYSKYNQIYHTIINQVPKDRLILLSLGMAATVLAYDLAKNGYQAIDIGHLDIEYEWFRVNTKDKIGISGKYVNEALGGNIVGKCTDSIYKRQIIAYINL